MCNKMYLLDFHLILDWLCIVCSLYHSLSSSKPYTYFANWYWCYLSIYVTEGQVSFHLGFTTLKVLVVHVYCCYICEKLPLVTYFDIPCGLWYLVVPQMFTSLAKLDLVILVSFIWQSLTQFRHQIRYALRTTYARTIYYCSPRVLGINRTIQDRVVHDEWVLSTKLLEYQLADRLNFIFVWYALLFLYFSFIYYLCSIIVVEFKVCIILH